MEGCRHARDERKERLDGVPRKVQSTLYLANTETWGEMILKGDFSNEECKMPPIYRHFCMLFYIIYFLFISLLIDMPPDKKEKD